MVVTVLPTVCQLVSSKVFQVHLQRHACSNNSTVKHAQEVKALPFHVKNIVICLSQDEKEQPFKPEGKEEYMGIC